MRKRIGFGLRDRMAFWTKENALFLVKFLVLFFVPYAFIHVVDLSAVNEAVAGVQGAMLNAAGLPTAVQGTHLAITVGGRQAFFNMIIDCSGLMMVILFFALLYSTPIKRGRLKWLLAFTPLLLAFNAVRLFVTIAAAVLYNAFEVVHMALWFVDSAVVLLCWAFVAEIKLW